MTDANRTVALVGRPNVGKSRLFNRIAGRRLSIVHDMPGVTRDVLSAEVERDFLLLDTGGLGMSPDMTSAGIAEAAEEQVEFAVQAARVVVLVVDGREGPAPLDETVAERLRRFGKIVFTAVNKLDDPEAASQAEAFAALAAGPPIAVSAEHGHGVETLVGRLREALGPAPEVAPPEPRTRLALIGRPNVGKSSIANRLLQAERLLVNEAPGTTRDAVELDLDYAHPDGETLLFRLIDTAGIRSKKKVASPVEYFSGVRTQHALERADVVFLVIDALDGVTRHDQALAGAVLEAGKAIAVAVNKWDRVREQFAEDPPAGYRSLKEFLKAYEDALRRELFFLPDAPVVFTSAVGEARLEGLLEQAAGIRATLDMQLPTGQLNRVLRELVDDRPPPARGAKRFKLFYAVQTGSRPFRIRCYCNQAARLDPTYRRYLENGLIEAFRLEGCPVRLELVGKTARYRDGEADGDARASGDRPAKQSPANKKKAVKQARRAAARSPRQKPVKRGRKRR